MNNVKRLGFLLVYFISGVYSFGKQEDIKFVTYTNKDGISQSSVVSIFQGDEGFMWFGTYKGLNRFDGYNTQVFLHDENDSSSLGDNHVRAFCQDTDGIIFIATINGLDRFFTKTNTFVHFKQSEKVNDGPSNNQIYDIIKDKEGIFWLATWGGGLNKMEKYKPKNASEKEAVFTFTHYLYSPNKNSISSNDIPDIIEGPDGKIWIASRKGLNVFDKTSETFTQYLYDPDDKNSLSSNNVSSVCFDQKGDAWIGTWEGGVNRYNLSTNKFSRFYNEPNNKFSLSHNIVMSLFCDKSGKVWAGTWGGGLNRIVFGDEVNSGDSRNDVLFYRYQFNKIDVTCIGSNSIYDIFQDKTGVLWVGCDWGGVSKFKLEGTRFKHVYAEQTNEEGLVNNIVFNFLTDKDGKIWIGTHEGVNRYDPNTNKYEVFLHDPGNRKSISDNQVKSIIQTRNGDIWMGTTQGLNKFNPDSKTFDRYYIDPHELGSTCIMKLYESSDGNIWIGTFNFGLYRFSPSTKNFEKVIPATDEITSSANDIIWSIIEDKNQQLWFGLIHGGLFMYDLNTKKFTCYRNIPEDTTSLSSNAVFSLFIDTEENLWVGTERGLNKLVFNTGGEASFIRYSLEDGLSDQLINAIIQDDYNNLWISTNKGLTRFDIKNNTFKVFTVADGLQDDEFSINGLMKYPKTGKIYVGGINGFNIFDPGKIINAGDPPTVKNVALKIYNKPVNLNEKINNRVILDTTMSAKKQLKLTYQENVFTIEFSALYYDAPGSNQYAFMLEGFDKEWNYVEKQRAATYTNLKPDKYTFKVKAANPDGVWSKPSRLEIIIKPPWWNTFFIKILFFVFMIALLIFIYQLRLRIMRSRQRSLESTVEQRTLELSKSNVLLEEKQEEISVQNNELLEQRGRLENLNKELQDHRKNLERTVEQRTAELKAAKQKAEESDRLKSSFLANMSHEVRTPMNAIIGFSNLLEEEETSKEEQNEYIHIIKSNGDTLLRLIDDIIDISIIQADQLKLNMKTFCVDEVMREVNSYMKLKNDKKLNFEYKEQDLEKKTFINNDVVRFKQILNNLVNNALKYTDKGFVKFGYILKGNEIEVYVEDSGIGIEEEDKEHIFEYFYKIEKSKDKFYRGTGIGLAICKQLITMMGSDILIDSKVGVGSRFYFRLPVYKEKEEITPVKNETTERFPHSELNILIAEDEMHNFAVLNRFLLKMDATVYRAKNGKEAVDMCRKLADQNIEFVILMDIKMPLLDGEGALKEIRKFNKTVPIVAVTAYAQLGDEKRFINEGFNEYVSKPINFSELEVKVRNLMEVYKKND